MASKLTFYRGDTVNVNLALTGVNLTGATVYFTAKATVDDDSTDAAAVIKKNVTSHTNPTLGLTTVTLTPTDTNCAPGKYGYDVQLKTALGDITTIQVGTVEVLGDYTRRSN